MNVTLIKIRYGDSTQTPAYVATDITHSQRICDLLGTVDTVWSEDTVLSLRDSPRVAGCLLTPEHALITLREPPARIPCVVEQPGRPVAKRPRYVLSACGTEKGEIIGERPCRMEGCGSMAYVVRWASGRKTYPCAKACYRRDDETVQIAN